MMHIRRWETLNFPVGSWYTLLTFPRWLGTTYVVHPLEPEVRRVRPDLALEVGVVAHVDVGRVQRGAKAERHHGGIWN